MLSYQNFELRNSIGRITLPYFDGTSKCIVNSRIQKLDTYFQLNPMDGRDSIKVESLNLDEGGNGWLFHEMKTLGHDQVATYQGFTQRLVERFDWRYPDISF